MASNLGGIYDGLKNGVKQFTSDVKDTVTGKINDIRKDDPVFRKKVETVESNADISKIAGIATLIVGIALAILGIGLCFSGNLGGVLVIMISLPLIYAGYNAFAIGKNLQELARNTTNYSTLDLEKGWKVDLQKVKALLSKDTFAFRWAVNRSANFLVNDFNN